MSPFEGPAHIELSQEPLARNHAAQLYRDRGNRNHVRFPRCGFRAPFHHMIRGAGFRMSVLMTDCRRSRLGDGQKSAKRVQQIRKERDELERIYEATWLELENAIGSKAAEAIRKSVEETTEAGAVQLELPLEKKRNFDLEGEAKCNQ